MKYLLYRKKGIKGACEGCEDLNIISFRPTPVKLTTMGESVSIGGRFVRLMFFLLTRGKAYILCVKNDHNKIVHTSYVIPKCSKFSFMAKEDWENKLCGYSLLEPEDERFIRFSIQKTDPDYEGYGLNAALVEAILMHHSEFLANNGIICDGERSVSHETNFQDYLEKYFGFRKAYCVLHVVYKPILRPIVFVLYPFRNLIKKLDKIKAVHMIVALLNMESINRSSK